jgi:hypothetical protein
MDSLAEETPRNSPPPPAFGLINEGAIHTVGKVLSFFSSRRNWDSPQTLTRGKGHIRWRERGWESPISDEGTYTVVLFIYTCFVALLVSQDRRHLFLTPLIIYIQYVAGPT